MKLIRKIILITAFFTVNSINSWAEEISLFNSNGDAIAYIDTQNEDLTIYMWNGLPVAYLVPDGVAYSIYGFNGEHLGWYQDGIIRDHSGYGVGFRKGATSIYTNYEPYKSYKQYKPYKKYKKYAPYMPYFKSQFSNESLSLFLMRGKQ